MHSCKILDEIVEAAAFSLRRCWRRSRTSRRRTRIWQLRTLQLRTLKGRIMHLRTLTVRTLKLRALQLRVLTLRTFLELRNLELCHSSWVYVWHIEVEHGTCKAYLILQSLKDWTFETFDLWNFKVWTLVSLDLQTWKLGFQESKCAWWIRMHAWTQLFEPPSQSCFVFSPCKSIKVTYTPEPYFTQ